MSAKEIAAKVEELKELKNMLEELTAEITAAEDAIKAEMTARGVDELTAGAFKVRWKMVKSSRLDTTAIRKELPELAERFTKVTESRRFTVA